MYNTNLVKLKRVSKAQIPLCALCAFFASSAVKKLKTIIP